MNTVYFPNIGLEFNLSKVAFSIGPLTIYWYGVIIAAGFVLALIYAMKRAKEFGVDADRFVDVVLIATVGAIVFARLYYVVFSWDNYKDDLAAILRTWDGGIAIYGGLIGAFIFGAIACKIRKVKILPAFDLAAAALLIGQAVGRWGNFVNQEAFGTNTNLPWGMTGDVIKNYLYLHSTDLAGYGIAVNPELPVHPTFLYESLWCIAGFAFIALITKRRRFDGELTLVYLAWYGLGRAFIEGMRTDSLMLGTLRFSQLVAILTFVASVFVLLAIRGLIKRENDPDYMKIYALTDDGKAVAAGTYYKKAASEKAETAENDSAEAVEETVEAEVQEEEPATASEESDSTSEAEVEAEQEAAVESEQEPETEPAAEVESEQEPESEPETEVENEQEPEVEPETEA